MFFRTLVLLLLVSPCHATWISYYQGNTQKGQLADTIGLNTLTMTNVVGNPASPTPHEGDRWLGFDFFTPSAFFKVPIAAIPSNATGKLVFAFGYSTEPCCGAAAAQTVVDIENGANTRYMTFLFMGKSTGWISDYTNSAGSNIDIRGSVNSWSLNSNHLMEIGWSSAGVYISADSVVLANSATLFDQGTIVNVWVGSQGSLLTRYTQNYIDGFAISNNLSDVYPPNLSGKQINAATTVKAGSRVVSGSIIRVGGTQ